ncbi:DegT/DnrJ/EryC1/StrS family aminotransferase [Shewanella chilikensis]|uniref:DegT/DnrJ/EryC1/StrS aminotransferase family protein n=1 Tax=Shewanella chilikensis TaxID=558541 RepID=UPI00399B2232
MTIPLNKPVSPNLAKLTAYLEKVNESGWYTNFGPLHNELSKRLEQYLGVENLLLVSNGTLAIQIACKVLKVNKALTTPFSFVATSSSLLWQGIDIDYVDIDEKTLNLSPSKTLDKLNKDSSYDGIVATHVYGNPCDIDKFDALSNKYNIKIIYDGAHAFGVNYNNRSILSYGDATTLSFHATKVFHTVEGGAIVFKKREDYLEAKRLINFGINEDGMLGPAGINAKLNEYQCAVGLCLLDDIESIICKRIELFTCYLQELKEVVDIPKWQLNSSFNGAYMPIILKSYKEKELVKSALLNKGIQSRDYFYPSLNLVYKASVNMPISEDISERILCLPLHYYVGEKDIFYIGDVIKNALCE